MATIIYETTDGESVEEDVENLGYHDDRECWYWPIDRDEDEDEAVRKYVPRERVYEVLEEVASAGVW